jgi:dTDP-4-dehydrorhamnose reductase
MRVLLIGATGLLGSEVHAELVSRGHEVDAPASDELDITDDRSISAYFLGARADWIVNCAAYTAVDQAEEEPHRARLLNSYGPMLLARVTTYLPVRMLHFSTDFVFDGKKGQPYLETDETNPLSVYAKTKLEGEQHVIGENPDNIVVRTAWLFGTNGKCFPTTILRLARQGEEEIRVVSDQRGSPTFAPDLASAVSNLIEANAPGGVYHVVNSGEATWYELAVETLAAAGLSAPVTPIRTEDWPTKAQRPAYSVLATERYRSLGFPALPDWRDAVQRYVQSLAAK